MWQYVEYFNTVVYIMYMHTHNYVCIYLSIYLSIYNCLIYGIYLTSQFHVLVHLFCNRSQMMSKCGMNKKVAHKTIAECVTDGLIIILRSK